jgi:TPR repeat protein
MYKTLCFALAAAMFSTAAFADEEVLSFSESINEPSYFNYKSDRCDSIKDPKELFSIAMSLRDSTDKKEQVAAVDCMTIAAVRGHGPAEYELARMYAVGNVVTQSDTFAYRWAQMAVMDKYEPAVSLRDSLEKKLSVEDLETALNEARRIYDERERAKFNR